MSAPPNSAPSNRRQIFAWAMYEWATGAYAVLLITVLESYITKVVLPDNDQGVLLYTYGLGITMMVAALLSPVIGAMADARANKRLWLFGTTVMGAGASALMFFATPDRPWLLGVLFIVANLGLQLALGIFNAFLPELTDDQSMGRVSAFGYSLGYAGSFLVLALVMLMFHVADTHGHALKDHDYLLLRLALLIMGLWWAVFSLPILLMVRDKSLPRSQPLRPLAACRRALGEVRHTLAHIKTFRTLALFLLGFLIFNDGITTVVATASVFAQKVLDMSTEELLKLILLIQFVALLGALAVGYLADWIGQKNALMACLAVWVGVLTASFWVDTRPQFWALAVVVALVLGGTQSVSRTIMGLMTPKQHTAEFFGFFNLSSKAASMFGPVFFGTILKYTGKVHLALASLLLFFIVGWLFILPIDLARGQREARAEGAG